MRLNKIKYKLIAGIGIIAILPAIPLSYLFQNMIDKLFSLRLNNRIETALEDAVDISRTLIQNEKKTSLKNTRQFIENPMALSLLRKYTSRQLNKNDVIDLVNLKLLEANKLDGVVIYDNSLEQIFLSTVYEHRDIVNALKDTLFARNRLLTNSESVDHREAEHLLVTGIPVALPNQQRGVILSVVVITPGFYGKTESVLTALQFYKTFDVESENIKASFFYAFLSVYFVIICLSIGLSMFFSAVMTHPIKNLALGTEQISKGNLDYQINIKPRNDEIGQLMVSFNQMVQNIKQEQGRILYLEKMSAWREIAQRLAHEIKNPLTPIQLTVQQIKDSYKGNDPKYKKILEECYEIVDEEIQSLRNLTNEFSEFARMPSMSFKPAQLNHIIKDVVAFYANVRFKLLLQDDLPTAELDAEAVKRIIINLVDNSLSATGGKPDSQITISTRSSETTIRLIISDNGHGIPKENLVRIFEPHFSTKTSSMGLGLAIVKSMIEEHKGQIEVDSIENLGTTFTIDFKIKAPNLFDNV
ncbi:HAMP domain-containing protein [bacterium]|nr:HAMP domain-containing protein [bacterium]